MCNAQGRSLALFLCASFFTAAGARAAEVGTAFTYQGSLEKPPGTPVTDACDFRFGLWDAAAGGNLGLRECRAMDVFSKTEEGHEK